MTTTKREAFTAGWTASKRTKTYDLDAAEARFEAKHGTETGSAFAAGWTAYAAGEAGGLAGARAAYLAAEKRQAEKPETTTPHRGIGSVLLPKAPRVEHRPINLPVYAVYNSGGEFVAGFTTLDEAADYLRTVR